MDVAPDFKTVWERVLAKVNLRTDEIFRASAAELQGLQCNEKLRSIANVYLKVKALRMADEGKTPLKNIVNKVRKIRN